MAMPIRGQSAVQARLDKGADALDGALKVLGRYVGHVTDEEGEALAGFDKGQRIVGQLTKLC